ncbi:hypothetical protein [Methanobrevibacter sp.]|uniref:hypothetical protein n=1 Tax=Methanobrevibacter sp. TaxID=66852 RepID=UPI00388D0E18
MKEIIIEPDFDVDEVTERICSVMSKWSIHFLDIIGPNWVVYDYDMNVKCVFIFHVDFYDMYTRIKLEDLKLNVIHHIEGLKDETIYRDNLISEVFFKD